VFASSANRPSVAVDGDCAGDFRKYGGECPAAQGDIGGDIDGVGFAVAVGGIDGGDERGLVGGGECSSAGGRDRQQQEDQRGEY